MKELENKWLTFDKRDSKTALDINNVQLTNYCLFQTHHRGEQFAGGPVFCECCTPLGHVYKNKDMLSFHSIDIDYQLIHNSIIQQI